jgi:glucose-6-phosphate isomerase
VDYFEGDLINQTENRAVLHTALRAKESAVIKVNDKNIVPEIYEVKNKIKSFRIKLYQEEEKGLVERRSRIL